jgi:hypothetical protein
LRVQGLGFRCARAFVCAANRILFRLPCCCFPCPRPPRRPLTRVRVGFARRGRHVGQHAQRGAPREDTREQHPRAWQPLQDLKHHRPDAKERVYRVVLVAAAT